MKGQGFLNFWLCQHPDLEGHPLPLPRKMECFRDTFPVPKLLPFKGPEYKRVLFWAVVTSGPTISTFWWDSGCREEDITAARHSSSIQNVPPGMKLAPLLQGPGWHQRKDYSSAVAEVKNERPRYV